MDSLNFLSVKAVAENLTLKESIDLINVVSKRINNIKTAVIKEKILSKISMLNKYKNFIDSIYLIKIENNFLMFEFYFGGSKYKLNYDTKQIYKLEKMTLSREDFLEGWVHCDIFSSYVKEFRDLLYSEQNLEIKNNIKIYLSPDEFELEL